MTTERDKKSIFVFIVLCHRKKMYMYRYCKKNSLFITVIFIFISNKRIEYNCVTCYNSDMVRPNIIYTPNSCTNYRHKFANYEMTWNGYNDMKWIHYRAIFKVVFLLIIILDTYSKKYIIKSWFSFSEYPISH